MVEAYQGSNDTVSYANRTEVPTEVMPGASTPQARRPREVFTSAYVEQVAADPRVFAEVRSALWNVLVDRKFEGRKLTWREEGNLCDLLLSKRR